MNRNSRTYQSLRETRKRPEIAAKNRINPKSGDGARRMVRAGVLVMVFTLVFGFRFAQAQAQTQGGSLLIEAGTLIDGTGAAAMPQANVLIEDGSIRRVWTGAVNVGDVPAGVQRIDARGKFILPGLIDSHVHYNWYMGEMFLAHGVTAVYDLGNPIPWQQAVQKGLNEGKIRGPRFYFCGRPTEIEGEAVSSGAAVRGRDVAFIRGPQDAKRAMAEMKANADCVKLSEYMDAEMFTALAREAQMAGMGVISHSLHATDSTRWGIGGMEHMTGIAIATITSAEGRAIFEGKHIEAGHKNSALYQHMDPALFDALIEEMVRNNVYINPTLDFEWQALTEHAEEHELEVSKLLADANLQYVPTSERLLFLGQYHWADERTEAEREEYRAGYKKVQEFLRRFVQAGGKIYSGTDSAAATTPGISIHLEMELLVDAGLMPMQAIQSSTGWAAEVVGFEDRMGSVEEGKLADLVILSADPLADIRNTKRIETVIQRGEVVDTSYHSDYSFPFLMYGPVSKHLYNPVPAITSIEPPVVPMAGSAEEAAEGPTGRNMVAEIRVRGRGFVQSTVVKMGEMKVPTEWVSATELRARVPDDIRQHVGTVLVTVVSPMPGGGPSAPLEFYIIYK